MRALRSLRFPAASRPPEFSSHPEYEIEHEHRENRGGVVERVRNGVGRVPEDRRNRVLLSREQVAAQENEGAPCDPGVLLGAAVGDSDPVPGDGPRQQIRGEVDGKRDFPAVGETAVLGADDGVVAGQVEGTRRRHPGAGSPVPGCSCIPCRRSKRQSASSCRGAPPRPRPSATRSRYRCSRRSAPGRSRFIGTMANCCEAPPPRSSTSMSSPIP